MAALLAVPALRLMHLPDVGTLSVLSSVTAMNGTDSVYSAGDIREKARPLLERLAPQHEYTVVIRGMAGRTDGSTQPLWTVVTRSAPSDLSGPPDMAEVRYDADTGELVYASTMYPLHGTGTAADTESVPQNIQTTREAVQAARAWVRKMGMTGGGNAGSDAQPAVVFPPEKSKLGVWRVWLSVRETPETPDTPDSPALTVEVVLKSQYDSLVRAVVVDRSALPFMHLP